MELGLDCDLLGFRVLFRAMPDFFEQPPDEIDLVLVTGDTLTEAALLIVSCEACRPEDCSYPFDWVLDFLMGRPGCRTDYLLPRPAKCPNCGRNIVEKTLVHPEWTDATDVSRP